MLRKIITIIILGLIFGAAISSLNFRSADKKPGLVSTRVTTAVTTTPVSENLNSEIGDPQTLIIPKLDINVEIEKVGYDEKNRMGVPSDWDGVGWFMYGPKPGATGKSVLAGHLDSPSGAAIFWDLNKLSVGDEVHVIDQNGITRVFDVYNMETLSDEDFPVNDVFGSGPTPDLNLITCEGTFDKNQKNYSHRLVVFTRLKQ